MLIWGQSDKEASQRREHRGFSTTHNYCDLALCVCVFHTFKYLFIHKSQNMSKYIMNFWIYMGNVWHCALTSMCRHSDRCWHKWAISALFLSLPPLSHVSESVLFFFFRLVTALYLHFRLDCLYQCSGTINPEQRGWSVS